MHSNLAKVFAKGGGDGRSTICLKWNFLTCFLNMFALVLKSELFWLYLQIQFALRENMIVLRSKSVLWLQHCAIVDYFFTVSLYVRAKFIFSRCSLALKWFFRDEDNSFEQSCLRNNDWISIVKTLTFWQLHSKHKICAIAHFLL